MASIRPLHDRLVVRCSEPETGTASGIAGTSRHLLPALASGGAPGGFGGADV
ncbi:hypothetical protein [Pseudorhodoferax sp. Leaf274]|uniref:hypothetical protein n=1 Tax=Pseudorhodoferax sp. Leaf274 TaxID=1736318 RepID=UPI0012E1570E|nr:hypothetical protein [Pseudorhodoferax sp. Leaf274]